MSSCWPCAGSSVSSISSTMRPGPREKLSQNRSIVPSAMRARARQDGAFSRRDNGVEENSFFATKNVGNYRSRAHEGHPGKRTLGQLAVEIRNAAFRDFFQALSVGQG